MTSRFLKKPCHISWFSDIYNQMLKSGITYGHVQMYNGTQWISNYNQNNFWPGGNYRTYQPSFEIYRRSYWLFIKL